MDQKSCCFIGHRTITITDELYNRLSSIIEGLICTDHVTCFLFGSRSQFNDLCFDIVTALKNKYPQIKRIAYNTRSECAILDENRLANEAILSKYLRIDTHIQGFEESITSDAMYVSGKASYIERNQIMIDASDYCIFYYDSNYAPQLKRISNKGITGVWTSGNSGTKLAYKYAMQKHKVVINVFQQA